MKIYDISQEVFGCQVFAGDPAPEKKQLCSIEKGDLCNLTAFGMCAHNGTHIDAPVPLYQRRKTVDSIGLDTFVVEWLMLRNIAELFRHRSGGNP